MRGGGAWQMTAALLLCIAAGSGLGPASAEATVDIRPAAPGQVWIRTEATRGTSVAGRFVVINPGPRVQTIRLYPVDATLDKRSGAFTPAPDGVPSSDVGAWLALSTTQLRLAPGGSRELGFTLTVPAVAAPGRHTGAIVAEGPATTAAVPGQGNRVRIVTRLGLRIYVQVPAGSVGGLALSGLKVAPTGWSTSLPLKLLGLRTGRRVDVSAQLTNTGPQTGLVSGRAQLTRGSTVVASSAVTRVRLAPGRGRRLRFPLHLSPGGGGGYRARVVIDAQGTVLSAERGVRVARWSVSPFTIVAVVALAAALLTTLVLRRSSPLLRRRG